MSEVSSRRTYASRLRSDFRSYDTPAVTRWLPPKPTLAPPNYDAIVADMAARRRLVSHWVGEPDRWANGPWLRSPVIAASLPT